MIAAKPARHIAGEIRQEAELLTIRARLLRTESARLSVEAANLHGLAEVLDPTSKTASPRKTRRKKG